MENGLTLDPTAACGGMAKTLEILRRHSYRPGKIIQVRKFVRGCEMCKKTPNFRISGALKEE